MTTMPIAARILLAWNGPDSRDRPPFDQRLQTVTIVDWAIEWRDAERGMRAIQLPLVADQELFHRPWRHACEAPARLVQVLTRRHPCGDERRLK